MSQGLVREGRERRVEKKSIEIREKVELFYHLLARKRVNYIS